MARYLIIAGSSGIGQTLHDLLVSHGHEVIRTARDNSKINPDYILDATDFSAVESVFQSVGQIDGVVNCAGSLLLKPAHLTSFDEYQSVIQASLTSAFAVVRAAGLHMRQGGSVVLISSTAAQIGLVNHEAISSAKAGIIGLARSAAASYASMGLRFNVVAPGLTETELTKALTQNEAMRKASEQMHPLGRIGQTTDIAQAIYFFLQPENNWITGQVLAVDGGLSSVKPRMKA
jgi:NAD(P)-dependent dehydrogenase (short-subunit alcohol dehydrogenase family)